MFGKNRLKYVVRPWRTKDIASLSANANNILIWNNVNDSFPNPYSEEDAREFITFAMKKVNVQDFAIEIEGEAVGGIGFIPGTDIERYSAELGYWIGEKYWGHGIMTSAVKEVVEYVFDQTDIIRLYATVFAKNRASIHVMRKNKFRKVGILHNAAVKNEKIIDMHYYELLK